MKHILVVLFSLATSFSALADQFPTSPNPETTPGSLCQRGNTRRYPEGILYCNRDVDSGLKKDIIKSYDARFGYHIGEMNRGAFKIDHYIPLCMGGSNEEDNLWPQHESVYIHTDQLEAELCGKMSAGRLKQAEAIHIIKQAKNNLGQAESLLSYVRGL